MKKGSLYLTDADAEWLEAEYLRRRMAGEKVTKGGIVTEGLACYREKRGQTVRKEE